MTTNPADWTDAEIARWMAKRDGWRVVQDGCKFLLYAPGDDDWLYGTHTESDIGNWLLTRYQTRYPHSLDAAVGWLGRMGLRWMRYGAADCVGVSNGSEWFNCHESPTCPTARALCNAGWAAVQAREVSES